MWGAVDILRYIYSVSREGGWFHSVFEAWVRPYRFSSQPHSVEAVRPARKLLYAVLVPLQPEVCVSEAGEVQYV